MKRAGPLERAPALSPRARAGHHLRGTYGPRNEGGTTSLGGEDAARSATDDNCLVSSNAVIKITANTDAEIRRHFRIVITYDMSRCRTDLLCIVQH